VSVLSLNAYVRTDRFVAAYNLGMNAFGGNIDIRVFTLILLAASTFSVFRSWKGIRDLRIDIHRAWTIRCWGFVGSVSLTYEV
jgi:hypothetical protein